MKKRLSVGLIVAIVWVQVIGGAQPSKEGEKILVKKENGGKKKGTATQQGADITPYQAAKNISTALNYLAQNQDMMTDHEPLLVQRRKVALNIYRAEAFCVITMADACFPQKEGDMSALMNWVPLHPLLGKDVYAEIQKFIRLNFKYNNTPYYKANQGEMARDRLREVIHENIFSIVDALNKTANLLPDRFYYSGHPYEPIAPIDQIELFEVLASPKKVDLSRLDECFCKWQVAFYRNIYYLLKQIAAKIVPTITNDPDTRDLIKGIAEREQGDNDLTLPEKLCPLN